MTQPLCHFQEVRKKVCKKYRTQTTASYASRARNIKKNNSEPQKINTTFNTGKQHRILHCNDKNIFTILAKLQNYDD